MTLPTNLFADLPAHLPAELVTKLLDTADVRIERIISHGHASPADFWYDQPQAEWVIVLKGRRGCSSRMAWSRCGPETS